jgi:hypothetical protein
VYDLPMTFTILSGRWVGNTGCPAKSSTKGGHPVVPVWASERKTWTLFFGRFGDLYHYDATRLGDLYHYDATRFGDLYHYDATCLGERRTPFSLSTLTDSGLSVNKATDDCAHRCG